MTVDRHPVLVASLWLGALTVSFLILLILVLLHPGPLPTDLGITRDVQSVLGVLPSSDAEGWIQVLGPVVVVILALLYERRWAAAGWYFASVLTCILGSGVLQVSIGRPGPPQSYGDSFPSVSVAESVVVATLGVFLGWKRFPSGRYVVLFIGISYVALACVLPIDTEGHWPTDVLGGLIFGAGWTIVALMVAARWARRLSRPT